MSLPSTSVFAVGDQVQAFVRPEHIRIDPDEPPDMKVMAGTVRDVVFLGESARCYIGLVAEPFRGGDWRADHGHQ